MNLDLNAKVVLITGGTGGIGSQIVMDFLLEGSIVVCLIRNKGKMKVLQESLKKSNVAVENLFAFECDLLNYDDLKTVTKKIFKQLNRIDVLINCAGLAHEYPFALLDKKQIDEMIDLNLKGPIYLSQAVLKYMYKQKEGSIVNISSVSSVKKGRGITVYAAAKSGLDSFTRTLALEVGRKNIRVNCVRPGVIETTMSGALLDRVGNMIKETTSLNRAGKVEEVSKIVLCLASNKVTSYMTGETINVDGGLF